MFRIPLAGRLARLVAVLCAVCLLAPAAWAQAGPSSILAAPPPSLAYDAGLGSRPWDARDSAGTPTGGLRTRGAWRGAKRGLLVGVAIGVTATAAAFFLADGAHPSYDTWPIIAGASVPMTVLSTGVGAIIGAARARPDPIPPPVVEVP